MKILAFTDPHGHMKFVAQAKAKARKGKVDLIICGGDLTIFGNQLNAVVKEISKMGKKVLLIQGNHETIDEMKRAVKPYKNLTFFHKKIIRLKDKKGFINFMGWGEGWYNPADGGFMKWARKAVKTIKKGERVVFVTHAPPFGTVCDSMSIGHVGMVSFRDFIEKYKPMLALCGHIHEGNNKKEVLGKTLIMNPGHSGTVLKV